MDELHLHPPQQQKLQSLWPKCSRRGCDEWIFRDVPSDITIEVDEANFELHKFPLATRSAMIRKLIAERNDSVVPTRVDLKNLPGGAETFDMVAKFCYGMNFEITASNVAQLLCVSNYLEMSENFSKDNLGSRSAEYFESIVCKNLVMCVEVLRHCETLLPLADELGIVARCIDGIATRACAEQIASSFSRLEYSSSGRLHMNKHPKCDDDWWIEDLSVLRLDFYQSVITSMKFRGVRPESISSSLMHYAHQELTEKSCLWNSSNKNGVDLRAKEHERRVVETVAGLLPVEKQALPITFLFALLRRAVMLDCEITSRGQLEKRLGSLLPDATIDDLLIPSFRHSCDTLFDVDTVHRILVNFSENEDSEEDMEESSSVFESSSALSKVAKLIDNYLAEVAPDANLKFSKFIILAEELPARARMLHDGLYRAIDVYLKAHPNLSEEETKELCKLIDLQKLSQEAAAHAAQNERLPIHSIVQVLYHEHVRLRNAFCSYPEDGRKPNQPSWVATCGALSATMSPRDNYASLRRENRDLKLELTRLRMRLNDLEKDHITIRRQMQKSYYRRLFASFQRLSFFSTSSSRGSTSPSKQSQRSESKTLDRTCATAE